MGKTDSRMVRQRWRSLAQRTRSERGTGAWDATVHGSVPIFISGGWRELGCRRVGHLLHPANPVHPVSCLLSFAVAVPLSEPHRGSRHRDRSGKRQQDGQDGEDDSGGGAVARASGLKKRGEQLARTVESQAAVPLFQSRSWSEERSPVRSRPAILSILSIPSILSPAVPGPVAMPAPSRDARSISRPERPHWDRPAARASPG